MLTQIVLVIALAFVPWRRVSAQTYTCQPATSEMSLGLCDYMIRLVTATDTALVAHRTLYQLPVVDASKVSIVTTAKVCKDAGNAYENEVNLSGTPSASRSMVVVKVGTTRYAIVDPAQRAGEYQLYMITDQNFVILARFAS